MKKSFNIIGILIGIGIMILGVMSSRLWGIPESIGIALTAAGGAIIGVSGTALTFSKMMKDKIFSREINDERNILIKYKSAYITGNITLTLIGIATIIFIALEYYISASITGGIFIINTILLIIIPGSVERKL